jgi:Tol biopolymer transport system component
MQRRNRSSLRGPTALLAAVLAATTTGAHAQSDAPYYELAAVTIDGKKQVLTRLPITIFAPRISPDGTQIAWEVMDAETRTARITVAERDDLGNRYELPLHDGSTNWAPAWEPDGGRIVFLAQTEARDRIWWQAADGSGAGRHLVDGRSPESWASRWELTYLTRRGNDDYGIHVLDVNTGESRELIDLPGSAEHSSYATRDGRYVAYVSDASGRFEVFVEPLPQTGERVQITTEGGGHPVWSRDGRTIFFDRDAQLFRIGFDPDTGRATGAPEALPIEGFTQGLYRRQFDLMPDGRFLMLFAVDGG